MGALTALAGLGVGRAEARVGQTRPEGKVGVTWLGHGSFLFKSVQGRTILFDPWIKTNPKCPVRFREPRVFGTVDMILWTHGHVDHFMLPDAKALIAEYKPKVIAPWELNFFIKSQIPEANCQIYALANKGATAEFDGVKITMTEAFHSGGTQLTGAEGTGTYVGEAVGYVMEFEDGFKLYHAGDTALMGDMGTVIGEFYKPDLAILPIGGVFTMGPKEAAYACKLIRPRYVIPHHFGTFPTLVSSPDGFVREVKKYAPKCEVVLLTPGVEIKL